MRSFLQEAARVRPTQKQLDWFSMEMYAFVHFSPNTFTDLEWGTGKEPEALFCPTKLDCDQWVEAIKSAGLQGMVLTAKHHDGFCLWPSKYTEHSVKNSPLGRDVVREAADACRRGGIKFGFYLSPWDRNSPYYGTPAYNDYFCNQLTELLTEYGEIFYVWFDNACGEGPNGIRQEYDFPRYFRLIRELQPNALIFNDYGPDVRWCGNEAGVGRHAEWAVVPTELCHYAPVQTGPGPLAEEGDLSYLYNTAQEIGALPTILYSKGLAFVPAEIDMSIRPGWFWHPQEEPHSLERLFQTYLASVGNNACFHLNIPPTREGLFDPRDVQRLREFGELLRREFGTPLPATVEQVPHCPPTQAQYTVTFPQPRSDVRYVVLQEDIAQGQRIESFRITGYFASGRQYVLYQGTCVGNKHICRLQDPFAGQNPLTIDSNPNICQLTVHVTAARDEVHMKNIQVF
ncbi:MAG TPA: alpha-L-fucosidase [Candidatus Acutalibacter pullicola]|uniref:alpha-L-fucosidase n=1 Tax=Candidatus Acutalibacter pullicola TaxID=2838417 RepID=A0A9D2MX46_9FIRM|nr:alpha-L-fucosidase [Candidatus Acutalibacter pullicola]